MKRTIVLMYHNIGIPPRQTVLRGIYVTPRMFKFQMWYLKSAGFRVVPLKEIILFMRGGVSDENLAAITFDDGYQDFYENAFPVLKVYNYPSTIFLVSDLVGKENLWDNERVGVRKKLLDWKSIEKLKGEGVTFGSHSRSHPFISSLSQEDVIDEVANSRSCLEEKLQLPVEFFCYPYGDYDARVVKAVKEAGYSGGFTTKRGLVHRGDDPFEIRRCLIRNSTHPLLFILRLRTDYEDRRGRSK